MKPTPEQSTKYYKIIKELSEYFGPKDIEIMFDVPYQSYYTYTDKYDLPKIQESKDMRNKYWKRIRQQAEDNEKRIRLENALKIYGEETKN